MGRTFLYSASTLAILLAGTNPAAAQTGTRPANDPVPAAGQAADPAAPAAGDDATADIVVTAQRREQRLKDVPIAVSVVGGTAIQQNNLTSIGDVAARLPNIKITTGQNANVLTIRGVGSGQNPGFEQSVATFVDGVYRGRSRSIIAALFDVDRVEVLRGPQTTFFGNNAIAGAINITTRKPGDTPDYNASALYGTRLGEYNLEAGVSMPLTPTLSIRVAGRAGGMDGYVRNRLSGDDGPHQRNWIGRVALHWTPTDTLTSDLRVDRGRSRDDEAFPAELLNCPPAPAFGGARGPCAAYLARSGGAVDDRADYRADLFPTFNDYDFVEAAWSNRLSLGRHTLTAITSYFDHENAYLTQLIPTPVPGLAAGGGSLPVYSHEDASQFTQELRLESPTGGTIEYTIGAYYLHANTRTNANPGFYFAALGGLPALAGFSTAATPIAGINALREKSETKSVFAALTVRPLDAVRVNFGARYTVVDKDAHRAALFGTNGAIPYTDTFVAASAAQQAVLARALGVVQGDFPDTSRTDRKFMPTVNVQYELSPQVTAYASYTKGFKAGGFANNAFGNTFDPETVNAYEVGIKGSTVDRLLTFNLALYRSDYDNLQESSVVFNAAGIATTVIRNAAASRSQGVEAGVSVRAAPWLTINTDAAYLDATYRDFPDGPCTALGLLTAGCVQDLSGKRRAFAPKFSGNIGATVTIPHENNVLRVDPLLYFSTRYFEQANADPVYEQRGFAKVDLRLGYGPADRHWEVALIGKNLTDKLVKSYQAPVSNSPGSVYALTEPPRTIALQLSLRR